MFPGSFREGAGHAVGDYQVRDNREVRLQDMRQVKIQPVRQRGRFRSKDGKFKKILKGPDAENLSPEEIARLRKARSKDRFMVTLIVSLILGGVLIYGAYALLQ